MLTRSIVAAAMLVGVALNPGQAGARELGLTPSHVYALWVNINESLIEVARVVSDDKSWRETVLLIPPKRFEGKQPSDVLDGSRRLRHTLERLGPNDHMASHLVEIDMYDGESGLASPSDVFVNSGHMLDGLVVWLIRNAGPEYRVSESYKRRSFHDKTPSDVFALMDLANRRLEIILSKLGV